MNTTTRRSALGFSTAAFVAGLTTPAIAVAAGASTKSSRDAALIDLCDQFVANETERFLLMDHDEHAPDFGPNNARYEQLGNAQDRLIEMIEACQSSTTQTGHAAMARAALTWVTLDVDGNIQCHDFGEEMMVKLAEGVATDFVWPPRAGSCSTAHWAPPTSPRDIAKHNAAHDAWVASINAETQAKKLADEAERHRRDTPSLMTEDELRGQLEAALDFRTSADRLATQASVELARRGLA